MSQFFRSHIFIFAFLFIGCAVSTAPVLTPLEIQSIQTREYEHGKNVAFASVISVFQDLGYIVKSADKETGFITAESAAQSDGASRLFGMTNVKQTIATAFVEPIGKITKIRLNFVNSNQKSFSYGQTDREDSPILDAKTYQNAFDMIETAMFVREGGA